MRGFTLIELLIVITIIAILSIIGIVAYSGFLQTARNNKRQSDLKIIQSALEDYHADQLYYPASPLGISLTFGSTKTYLNTVPTDPKGGVVYSYVPSPSGCAGSSCTSYCLSTNLEGIDLPDECPPAQGHNYGVTKP